MDSFQSISAYAESILVNDDGTTPPGVSMSSIINPRSVDFYYYKADDDAEFPYIVHRISNNTPIGVGFYQASWLWDIWDYGPSGERLLNMRRRILELFQRRFYDDIPGICAFRIWQAAGERDIPEEDNRIWRWHIPFLIRWYDTDLTDDLIARGQALCPPTS